jgi:hypothetical protein
LGRHRRRERVLLMAKAGLRGNPGLLRQVGARLQAMPKTVQAEVAWQGSPVCTELAQGAFDSGQTVYGEARPKGVHGQTLSLVGEGDARGSLNFVATGTQIRCTLGPRHMKYLIGKYKILPNNALPFRWRSKLNEIVARAAAREAAQALAGVARKAG